jgi:hypothetical protein
MRFMVTEANCDRCRQLTGCDGARRRPPRVAGRHDLIEFGIVPAAPSAGVRTAMEPLL